MKYKLIGLLVAISMTVVQVYAAPDIGDRVPLKQGELSTRQKVIIVPPSTVMTVLTTYELNSDALLAGQTVSVVLPDNFFYNDVLIAPKGSVLTGNVVEVERANKDGLDGKLHIRFSLITTPYGLQIPIAAVVKTKDLSGVMVGNSEKEQTLSPQKVVKSKTKTQPQKVDFKTVFNFGKNAIIPADTKFDIVLTQPITMKP